MKILVTVLLLLVGSRAFAQESINFADDQTALMQDQFSQNDQFVTSAILKISGCGVDSTTARVCEAAISKCFARNAGIEQATAADAFKVRQIQILNTPGSESIDAYLTLKTPTGKIWHYNSTRPAYEPSDDISGMKAAVETCSRP